VQTPGDMQLGLARLVEQVEDGRVLRICSGADTAGRFVQHEEACRLAGLEHFTVELDAVEHANVAGAVANSFVIHTYIAGGEQDERLPSASVRQVGGKAVQAHQAWSGDSPRAQRGQRQALSSACGGMAAWVCAAISTLKHQQGCSTLAG